MKLPSSFQTRVRALIGDEADALFAALEQDAPVSIRLNAKKLSSITPSIHTDTLQPIPWCRQGFYLQKRPAFTFDPLLHAGCYYVQEASSMFLEQVLKQHIDAPVAMLDLCAAPGGKSTHARSLLPEGSLLVSNEVIRSRVHILAENISKWGYPDAVVTNNDPSDFSALEGAFDVILTDVPCSGEGMFRKDPAAIDEWSPENVALCQARQRRIVADVWPALKEGGLFIYSTCTYNIEENEENINWIAQELGAEVLSVNVPDDWQVTGNLAEMDFPVYRFMPHKTLGEGFFLAVLRKTSGEANEYTTAQLEKMLNKRLRVVRPSSGVPPTSKGKDIIPSHDAAMMMDASVSYPQCELTYTQAIAYLRREAIVLSSEYPKGYLLVTYRNVPLGFVKNIGNRANNLYPQEWRIRSGYLPEEVWEI